MGNIEQVGLFENTKKRLGMSRVDCLRLLSSCTHIGETSDNELVEVRVFTTAGIYSFEPGGDQLLFKGG